MILAVVRIEDTEFSTRVVLKTNTRGRTGGISLEQHFQRCRNAKLALKLIILQGESKRISGYSVTDFPLRAFWKEKKKPARKNKNLILPFMPKHQRSAARRLDPVVF